MDLSPLEQQQLNVAGAPRPTFWHHVRFELVRRRAAAVGATGVLDIGAGNGLLGDHLAGTALGYRFAESSPALRRALVDRFGEPAADDDGPIGSTTLVVLLDVLEHACDDAALLVEVADRADRGTWLIVTVPAMGWLFSSWDRDLGHHRRYGRLDVVELVRGCGFDVTEASYLFPELVPIAVLRLLRRSDGTAAEFPRLPRWLDRCARSIASITTSMRRIWPVGTSVVVVARRSGASA